jgi:hypothetical protein
MPRTVTGSLFRTAIQYSIFGTACVNVLYFAGNTPDQTAAALLQNLIDIYLPAVRQVQGGDVVYTKATAVEVSRLPLQDSAERALSGVVGAQGASADAPQLATCINIRTGYSDRTRRGRFFLGGIPDTSTASGKLSAGVLPLMNTMLSALNAAYIAEGSGELFTLGVFSRKRYDILSNPFDDYWKPATGLAYSIVQSTMRSRKPAA